MLRSPEPHKPSHHLESPPCLGWNLPTGFQSTILSSEVSSCCLCLEVISYAGKSLAFIKKRNRNLYFSFIPGRAHCKSDDTADLSPVLYHGETFTNLIDFRVVKARMVCRHPQSNDSSRTRHADQTHTPGHLSVPHFRFENNVPWKKSGNQRGSQ